MTIIELLLITILHNHQMLFMIFSLEDLFKTRGYSTDNLHKIDEVVRFILLILEVKVVHNTTVGLIGV